MANINDEIRESYDADTGARNIEILWNGTGTEGNVNDQEKASMWEVGSVIVKKTVEI